MKIHKILFITAIAVCTLQAHAQKAFRRQYQSALKERYMDSLKLAREKFNLAMLRSNNDTIAENFVPDDKYARLFLPLTFYRGTTHNILSYDDYDSISTPAVIDECLLQMYLKRPDLVNTTESKLDVIGPTLEPSKEKTSERKKLAEIVAPKAVEPELYDIGIKIYKPNFWTFTGDYYLQFLQNYISDNWYNGGENNYSMVGSVTLQANYNNKQKVKWDNKLEMKLGLQTSESDSLHSMKTSEDLLRYTGKLGLQATKKWYYTLQMISYTQFLRGYSSNDATTYSDFASPLNINLSVGMDYTVECFKKKLKGTIHLAPAAYNFKYVGRLALATRYGLTEGHHTLNDIGSEFTADLKWTFTDMVSWKTRLYGYTTYSRFELEWENTITFQFNKYITSNLFIYPRFDDGVTKDSKHGFWQLKEYASLGFSYSF